MNKTFEEEMAEFLGEEAPKSDESGDPKEEEVLEDQEENEEEADLEEEESEEEPEEESEKPSDDRVDKLLSTIGKLEAKIEGLEKGSKKEEPETPAIAEYEPADFVGADLDIDDPKEGINKAINSAVQRTRENVMKEVVPIIQNVATQIVTTQSAINNFWSNNSDLVDGKTSAEVKDIKVKVGRYANAIQSQDSSKTLDEVLDEAGVIVRGKVKGKTAKKKRVARTPAPGSSKRKVGQEQGSGKKVVSDEIDDLFN